MEVDARPWQARDGMIAAATMIRAMFGRVRDGGERIDRLSGRAL
jgi:hypothetical protein